ncbi:MAG: bifunctional pyr operon transcriptional regulator/uracil phosphoribosyltransferase PyrR [Planctomycetota bacterium]
MTRRVILDANAMTAAIRQMATDILAGSNGAAGLALIGVHTRGIPIADRLAQAIRDVQPGISLDRGTVDITLYRDDIESVPNPIVRGSEITFDVSGKRIVLVDDVCFTGRTTRAAIDQIMDFGRPRVIELAVLVDRGHRELPIAPDWVGCRVETQRSEKVNVRLSETDGADEVVVE